MGRCLVLHNLPDLPAMLFLHVRTHKWVSGTHQKPERFFWAIAGHTDIHFPVLAAVPSTGQKELCEETCLLHMLTDRPDGESIVWP